MTEQGNIIIIDLIIMLRRQLFLLNFTLHLYPRFHRKHAVKCEVPLMTSFSAVMNWDTTRGCQVKIFHWSF